MNKNNYRISIIYFKIEKTTSATLFIATSLCCLCLSEFSLAINFDSCVAGLTWQIFIYLCVFFSVDLVWSQHFGYLLLSPRAAFNRGGTVAQSEELEIFPKNTKK